MWPLISQSNVTTFPIPVSILFSGHINNLYGSYKRRLKKYNAMVCLFRYNLNFLSKVGSFSMNCCDQTRNGEGNGTPLQYSCLENLMDGGAWQAAVHGVAKSQTRLSDFTFTFHFHALEKEMATHSNGLAWRTPGTGEPGRLPSMGQHRVGHD